MPSILVVPDPHCHPEFSNERFTALGNFIVDRQPDIIVNIGDFADMPSLCIYDKGLKSEGRRYKDDIDCANEALALIDAPITDYNNIRRRGKRALYMPRKVALLGNHDIRISKAAEQAPELYGTISTDDIQFARHSWEVVPFLRPILLHGIAFSHYFTNRGGNVISGDNVANLVLQRTLCSSVFGHSHIRDFSEKSTLDGRRIIGLNVGCFFDYDHEYANMSNDRFWRGLVMLHEVDNGYFEPEFVSMDRLKKEYL